MLLYLKKIDWGKVLPNAILTIILAISSATFHMVKSHLDKDRETRGIVDGHTIKIDDISMRQRDNWEYIGRVEGRVNSLMDKNK